MLWRPVLNHSWRLAANIRSFTGSLRGNVLRVPTTPHSGLGSNLRPATTMNAAVIPSRPFVPHIPTACPSCRTALEFPIPTPQPRAGSLLRVQCFKCSTVITHTFYATQIPQNPAVSSSGAAGPSSPSSGSGGQSTTPPPRKGRKIGTQERPLETGYYDILGVTPAATTEDVKKAYRRMAIKHHPDKNPDDPHAEERFKEIAIAYQTLSDPELRRKYNEYGPREAAPDGGYVDPEEVFGAIFGGEAFIPIIGPISLARDMKTALQEADEAEEEEAARAGTRILDAKGRPVISDEEKAAKEAKSRAKAAEKARAREERIKKLVENLDRKLSIFTESATGPDDREVANSWRTICALEADQLKTESYGVDLLQAIGFVYVSKAKAHMATSQTFLGVGGWLHNVQGKYHVFSETVSTIRSAVELKSVFDQIQAAERAGNLSPEEKRKLEEQAAEKGLQALFKGAKLEIESVLRETCDRILEDSAVPREKTILRAAALQILGEAYSNVTKDGQASIGDDSDYVRVETKQSRTPNKRDSRVPPTSPR
ncbi:J domain-containing protein [Mycena chlorophos]|uniref:J domain-containing protein n=1 Tax=Mycena chlorophos TaxID=658473 RepID=A0A8H6VTC6_MYCCL|nr:J domain-containing protein [Mycena chlorophos]